MATISTPAVARQSWNLFQKHWMLFLQCSVIVSLPLILIPPLGMALGNYCAFECSEQTMEFVGLVITCIFAGASFILKTSALHIMFLLYEGKAVSWKTMFDFKKHQNFMFRYFLFLIQLVVTTLIAVVGASLIIGLPLSYMGFNTAMLSERMAILIVSEQIVDKLLLLGAGLAGMALVFWMGIRIAFALFDYVEHTSRSFFQSLKYACKITRHMTVHVFIYHLQALFYYAWVLVPLAVLYVATTMLPPLTIIAVVLYSVWSAISVFHSICIYKALAK